MWNKNCFEVLNREATNNWILIHGICKLSNRHFACFNVYAPQSSLQKALLCSNLKDKLRIYKDISVVLLGDFNCVLSKTERENCKYRKTDIEGFRNFVKESDLIDVKLLNSSFTWFGPSNKRSKLDRAGINQEWASSGSWVLLSLRRKNSDHKPLMLKCSSSNWGPRPFKFFNCWIQDNHLLDNLCAMWKTSRSKGLTLCAMFKEIREYARGWNKTQFGNIHQRIETLEKELEEADLKNHGANEKIEISERLEELYRLKSSMLCQKARVNWQLEGVKNTKFFHRAIIKRKSRNQILGLQVRDNWLTNPGDIKLALFEHFRSFLGKENNEKVFKLGSVKLPSLDTDSSLELIKDFSMKEIEEALSQTNSLKSPGSDGFNAGVLKSLWKEIKDNIFALFSNFHLRMDIPRGSNASFIALIPKKDSPKHASDYRPISLSYLSQYYQS